MNDVSSISWSKLIDSPPPLSPMSTLPHYLEAIRDTDVSIEAHKNDTIIGLDIETTGFRHWDDEIRVIQMYGYPSNKLSILHCPDGEVPTTLVNWMNSMKTTIWLGHRILSFDARFLKSYGVDVTHLHFWDTLLVEGIVNAQHRKEVFGTKNSLQALAERYLDIHMPKNVDHSSWQNTLFPDLDDDQLKYAADDVIYLVHLLVKQIELLKVDTSRRTTSFELYTAVPVLQMATRGLPIDRIKFADFSKENTQRLTSTRRSIQEHWRGNPDSPKQVLDYLKSLGIKVESTEAQILKDEYGKTLHPFLRAILDYRKASSLHKYNAAWLRKWMTRDGTIQSSYNTTGTNTYRLSSREPNAQNYPREIRQIFGHPTEWMVVVDYSTVEMRIAAAHTKDRLMLRRFDEGIDIHRTTAAALFNKTEENVTKDERQAAKAANFAMIFGGGPGAIIRQAQKMELDPINEEEAARMRNRFFTLYEDMREFHGDLNAQIRALPSKGLDSLELAIGPFGHSRLLRNEDLKITTALNTPIQGQAAIGMKMTFILIAKKYPEILPYLAANVHDEIILTGFTDKELADECRIKLQEVMIAGMEEVRPGVKYEAEGNVVHYWNEAK